MPHIRPLLNKLWEIQLSGRDGIGRAIYVVAKDKKVIVIHAFIKKTQTTPSAAIKG
jgi:phage-related protein